MRRMIEPWCKLCLLLVLLSSCERRDLTYYTEAEFEIRVDWAQSGLDDEEAGNGATAVFYPQDGGTPKVVLMGDRSYEKVRLTAGRYDVLVFNRSFTDFGALAFRGELYHEVEAYARHVETRTDPETRATTRVIVHSPEKLAADVIEDFEVTEDMLGNYSSTGTHTSRVKSKAARAEVQDDFTITLAPQCLTREVKVQVNVFGLHNIRSAIGTLTGVAESVNLSTGKVSVQAVSQQFALDEIAFHEGSLFNGTLTGSFNTFGIETEIPRQLHLKALLVDGKTIIEESFDVTAREMEDESGDLVLYIELTASPIPDVKPDGETDSGFDADVEDWGDEIESEVPLM